MIVVFICTTDGNMAFFNKLPFSRVTVASFTDFLWFFM